MTPGPVFLGEHAMTDLLWVAPDLLAEATPPGDTAILTIVGEVDGRAISVLGDRITELATAGARRIVLDLGGASLTYAGLDLIADLLRRGVAAGAALALVAVPDITARALHFTGLDSLFTMHRSVSDALDAMGRDRGPIP